MANNATILRAKLTKNVELGKEYFVSWFKAKDIADKIEPGQFVMMESGQYLLRPFSVFGINNDDIGFLYRVVGWGTGFLSKLQIGDEVTIHGPLGKTFVFPKDKKRKIVIVAGGIGVATFPLVAQKAHELGYTVLSLFGARSINDLVAAEELKKYGELQVITDDGSLGRKGFVTELLEEELKKNKQCEIFVCGPTPMLKSVIKVCHSHDVTAQVSFEEFMACGYGVCMSCVIMTTSGKYIRTCVEGPVIKSDLVNA